MIEEFHLKWASKVMVEKKENIVVHSSFSSLLSYMFINYDTLK